YFKQKLELEPMKSNAIAAIETLIEFIRQDKCETLSEFREKINGTIDCLTKTDKAVTSVASGCELFLRFITLTSLDQPDFQQCRIVLVNRGQLFLKEVSQSRMKISKLCIPFISDGATILVHARSRVVIQLLKDVAASKKRVSVFVTESRPDCTGCEFQQCLTEFGIPTTVILDAAVGYIMEKVDLVLAGAEGVVESGGIINKIGTYQMAVMAKHCNKPFYVLVESFKFVRLYPLNQHDVPNEWKYPTSPNPSPSEHPLVDYTPPHFLTLLFTDLGVLTPSAVSDELIKLYS
ncbi:uncharacterized protein TRIADDRAFT_20160, partial [Trichoplax adhaerens]